MSETALAAAVLLQAADDYRSPEPPHFTAAGNVSSAWLEWDEAQQFISDQSGEWADSRATWCALAGVDPDAYRAMCMQ